MKLITKKFKELSNGERFVFKYEVSYYLNEIVTSKTRQTEHPFLPVILWMKKTGNKTYEAGDFPNKVIDNRRKRPLISKVKGYIYPEAEVYQLEG